MKNFQNIAEIKLPQEKKDEMWMNIVRKIELSENSLEENVRMVGDKRHTFGGNPSLFPNHKNMVNTKIFATMLIIIASIMGTSFAAEQALPGESLYAFKVNVNESVRSAFTFGAEARAKWEIEKIERRAEEKSQLEAQSQMTVTAKTEIESRSRNSAEKAREAIVELKTEGKAETATSLEGGLSMALNAVVSSKSEAHNESDLKFNLDAEAQNKSDIDTLDVVDAEKEDSTSSSVESDLDVESKLDLSIGR